MCPTCKTTLDQSDAPVAQQIKAFIRRRIAAGDSKQQIKDELVERVRRQRCWPRRRKHGLRPARVAAAARRAARRGGRGARRAGLALEPRAPRAEPATPTAGRRSTRSSSAGSTRSSRASIGLSVSAGRRSARRARSRSSRPACCRSSPATCRPSRRSRPTGSASAGVGRRVALASMPFVARLHGRSSSSSAPARRRSAASSTTGPQTELAGFVLVVLGLAFMGLLPWPGADRRRRAARPARGDADRGALLGAAFAVCAAPCIGDGARRDARPRRRLGHVARAAASCSPPTRSGSAVAFVARRRSPSRARWAPSAGCATTTASSSIVSGAILVALGLLLFFDRDWWLRVRREPRARRRWASGPAQRQTTPTRRRVAAALDLREDSGDVHAAVLGRVGPEPARRLLQLPLAADAVAAPGLVPGDRDVHEPLEEVALGRRRRRARRPRAPRAPRRTRPRRISSRPRFESLTRWPLGGGWYACAMATILLVGVDLFFRGKLEGLAAGPPFRHDRQRRPARPRDRGHRADRPGRGRGRVSRDVPILGFTNHTDTAGLRRAHAAGFDQVVAKSALVERAPRARRRARLPQLRPVDSAAVTYIIAEPCIDIKDLSCVDVCPVDCIHEFERILVIDPEECIDCGACEPECPVEAIFPEDALPGEVGAVRQDQLRLRRGRGGRSTSSPTSTPPSTTSRTRRSNRYRARGVVPPYPTEEGSDATASVEQQARAAVRAHQGKR